MLFNLLELDVECGKFEIPFGNLVTRNHKKNTLIYSNFEKKICQPMKICPQGKKKRKKKN
jgi:hypothetical protein